MESYQEVLEISDGSDDDDVGNNIVERNNSENNDTNLHSPSSTKKRAQNSPQSYIASPSKRRRGLGGTKTIDLTEVTVDHLESSEPETSNSSSSQNYPRIVGLDSLAEETSIIEIDSDEEDTEHPSIQYPMLKFIGSLKTKIVGVRYYHGIVTNGEHVYIKREPESAYDKNAIRIDNVQHTQVGHMPAHLAATLSPLLQQNVCIVEGSVIGERATFSAPLLLDFFTHPDIQEDLRRTLESRGIHLQDLRKTGSLSKKTIQKKDRSKSEYGASNDSGIQNFEQIQAKCTVVNSRAFSQALDALSLEAEDLKNMVPSDQPSRLQTSLLYYQRQGLRWMLQKENPRLPKKEEVVQLWRQTNNNSYINIATSFTTSSSPKLARGGLLADDMGLGKTLQIIALIVADRDTQPQAFVPFGIGEPTLIVAPTSLMSSW